MCRLLVIYCARIQGPKPSGRAGISWHPVFGLPDTPSPLVKTGNPTSMSVDTRAVRSRKPPRKSRLPKPNSDRCLLSCTPRAQSRPTPASLFCQPSSRRSLQESRLPEAYYLVGLDARTGSETWTSSCDSEAEAFPHPDTLVRYSELGVDLEIEPDVRFICATRMASRRALSRAAMARFAVSDAATLIVIPVGAARISHLCCSKFIERARPFPMRHEYVGACALIWRHLQATQPEGSNVHG